MTTTLNIPSNLNVIVPDRSFDPMTLNYLDENLLNDIDSIPRIDLPLFQDLEDRLWRILRRKNYISKRQSPYWANIYSEYHQLLLLSNWQLFRNTNFCGSKSSLNPSGCCNQRNYCYDCARRMGYKYLLRFLPSFTKGLSWHTFDLSFQGSLPFRRDQYENLIAHWDVCSGVLHQMVECGYIPGVYYVEELALISLQPLFVQAHVHVILQGELHLPDPEEFIELFQNFRNSERNGFVLTPSFVIKKLETAADLARRIRYMIKPIPITTEYRSAWAEHGEATTDVEAIAINRAMREFLEGGNTLMANRRMINTLGTLHSRNKGYIGIHSKHWDQYKDYVNSIH